MNTRPQSGILLPTMVARDARPGDVAGAARHAEQLGFESVWAVDQLIAGNGVPLIESVVALSAAAVATSHIRLGFGVMILPLRPVVWVAKQVASLQHVSSNRVILGVGVGGDRHELSWEAAGVARRERGVRTDQALSVLPRLIEGKPAPVHGGARERLVELSPGAPVPPIIAGGMSEAALRRAVDHDGWFALPLAPDALAEARVRLEEVAGERGRPVPPISVSVMVAIDGDPGLPDAAGIEHILTRPDGLFGMPREYIPSVLVTGSATAIAEYIARLHEAGADRVIASVVAGNWFRQAELFAEAWALFGTPR